MFALECDKIDNSPLKK
jgi:chromosome segregation ATPase